MANFKLVPPGLKSIQPYMKIAEEHEKRDPAITYWCRLYAVQTGLKLDDKSPESRPFLISLMDWLEKEKKLKHDDETIINDVVAQAHIENYALKLFLWADNEDRNGRFNKTAEHTHSTFLFSTDTAKNDEELFSNHFAACNNLGRRNVVKAFYTAGFLYDIVNTFGEPSEEVLHHRKYAKWKSTYIHNCLKQGITPVAGPMAMDGDEDASEENQTMYNSSHVPSMPPPEERNNSLPQQPTQPYPVGGLFNIPGYQPEGLNLPIPGTHAPPSTPNGVNQLSPSTSATSVYPQPEKSGDVSLRPEDYHKAQKYCKWAGSALTYEDIPTAIDNLQKALRLLTTGEDV